MVNEEPPRNGHADAVLEGIATLADIHGWTLELHASHNGHGQHELTLLRVKTSRKDAYAATIHDGDLRHATRRLWHKLPQSTKKDRT